jgi:hypothetical protein
MKDEDDIVHGCVTQLELITQKKMSTLISRARCVA